MSEREARTVTGGVTPPVSIGPRGGTPRGPDTFVLAWKQYRLERKLFWRNPSAAFFNFLLPLLFLAFFGAILHGNQHDLNVIVPGIAGMSVMSTTFTALAFNMTFLREQGVLKRIRGTPMPASSYLLRDRRQRRDQHGAPDRDHHGRGAGLLSAPAGRATGSSWSCSSRRGWCASRRLASRSRTRFRTSTRRRRT